MIHVNRQPHTGFTLVETLVAISILLLVVVGQMTVAQKGIKNSFFANEQMTAVFLAQEAIEAVRQRRDDNALDVLGGALGSTSAWVSGLTSVCGGGGCAYNNLDNTFGSCASNNSCDVYVSDGRYSHSSVGAIKTPFTREVTVGAATGGGVPVSVTVSWDSGLFGEEREVVLQTWVYDHYQRFEGF